MLTTVQFLTARAARARRSDRGGALIEYALLVSLVSVACIAAVQKFGIEVSNVFQTVTEAL